MAKHRQAAQSAVCWYAEVSADGCSINDHHFPEDQLLLVDGIDCMGPDTAALARDCLTAANRCAVAGPLRSMPGPGTPSGWRPQHFQISWGTR